MTNREKAFFLLGAAVGGTDALRKDGEDSFIYWFAGAAKRSGLTIEFIKSLTDESVDEVPLRI